MTSNPLLRAVTAAALALLLACSAGSPGAEEAGPDASPGDPTDSAAASEVPTGSESASETPSDDPVDPEAAALAEAAVLTLADMGSRYKRFNKAEGITPYTKETCDPDILSTVEAQYGGVMVKHKKEDAWIYSSSYVFPSKAEADEYVEARNAKEWLRCRAAEFDKHQKDNAGKNYSAELGNHGTNRKTRDVAYAQFVIMFKGEPTGSHILRYVFQEKRVVLNVGWEQSGNGRNDDLTDMVADDMARAVDEALRRLKEEGPAGQVGES